MCGIAGICHTDDAQAQATVVNQLLHKITHRGPDDSGVHVDRSIAIGMVRLSIIDVSGGHQPIFNEDGNIAIVCNGEIYNYSALRTELLSRGHRFRTNSDVEVILHLYEEESEQCFKRLNGMFSAAIADFDKKKLVLARDPFGQKPLYLWEAPGRLVFCSELKAIITLPGFNRELCDEALAAFITLRYIPAPLTIFRKVKKLLPGSWLSIESDGRIKQERYWQINLNHCPEEHPTNGADIRAHFSKAVDRHLMSERPLGVFLSGGVDSACIVSCMKDLGHKEVHTFTVGFKGYTDNEYKNARRTAKHFATEHTEILMSARDFIDSLPQVVYSLDEPMADMTSVPLYHLAEEAHEKVVVVLSGEGSDELLAGYTGAEESLKLFNRIDQLRYFKLLTRILSRLPLPDTIQRKLQTASGSHADYLANDPQTMGDGFDEAFWQLEIPRLAGLNPLSFLSQYFHERQDWHGIDLYYGGLCEAWLPDDLLHKADRMTMAHALEGRSPFLDLEFASYCARLPRSEKVRLPPGEASRKVALKREFATRLPEGLAFAPKKGFSHPTYDWAATHYAPFITEQLTRYDSALGTSLLTRRTIDRIAEKIKHGDPQSQRQVWSLVVLNLWGDCYL